MSTGQRKIEKIAIANRGEVAVRIIRACQELGIESVLLHSEADKKSLAYRLADEKICIGLAPTSESYLNIEANIQGALSGGVDAIHPGFGFLSENAEFAEACERARLIFIGPSPQVIRLFGDKVSAKKLVKESGGPVIPGYQGEDQSESVLLREMEKIGLPVIVKVSGGGGGRGLKVVTQMSEAREAIAAAKREGMSSFGSDRVFLEKYFDRAKHIEVQIFGDCSGHIYHLYDRECSVQRRHQKIIEEAMSPSLSSDLREQVAKTAVKIAQTANYQGAGTVEFLLQDEKFYFMEMNTRLQVEHPVTELVMGVDLVKAQILTSMGMGLCWPDTPTPRGHAIECRIYAEDSYQNGLPSTGKMGSCQFPQGPGRRFDVGFEPGDEITSFYDPMFAKVIVWDETRGRAIQKMVSTLKDTVVFGIKTNIPYLLHILLHPEFVEGSMTTRFISTHFPQGLRVSEVSTFQKDLAEKLYSLVPCDGPADGIGPQGDQSLVGERDNSNPNPWKYFWV